MVLKSWDLSLYLVCFIICFDAPDIYIYYHCVLFTEIERLDMFLRGDAEDAETSDSGGERTNTDDQAHDHQAACNDQGTGLQNTVQIQTDVQTETVPLIGNGNDQLGKVAIIPINNDQVTLAPALALQNDDVDDEPLNADQGDNEVIPVNDNQGEVEVIDIEIQNKVIIK